MRDTPGDSSRTKPKSQQIGVAGLNYNIAILFLITPSQVVRSLHLVRTHQDCEEPKTVLLG